MRVVARNARHGGWVVGIVCAARRGRGAFTAVELLVATVIMAVVVLGVYGVFRQALANEQAVSSRWRDRQGAVVVADYLAQSIENGVSLSDVPAVQGGPVDGGEGFELICLTSGQAGAERRRFSWGDVEDSGVLLQQTLRMAGAADVSSPLSSGEELTDAERWAGAPREVVAQGLTAFRVRYRTRDNPNARWRRRWTSDGPALVRVVVEVGEERIERYATWRTQGPLIADGEGEAS